MTKKFMSDDFKQTVNLRQMAERKKAAAEPLDQIYQDQAGKDLARISRPIKRDFSAPIRLALLALAILVAGGLGWRLFFVNDQSVKVDKALSWYALKLTDGTVYYGQVYDLKADPLNVNNVYYDYDQAKTTGADKKPADGAAAGGNLRLVKRGQETAGGDGSIRVYQTSVLYLEPLKADSKVLKAILEYEK